MFKKKSSILLLLLLAVLFIGLFSNSYARTLDETEIKNFILNAYQYKTNAVPSQTIIDNVLNSDFSTWANITETYEGRWIIGYNGDAYLWYYTGSETNLNKYKPYFYSSSVYVSTSYLSRRSNYYSITRNTFTNNVNEDIYVGSTNWYLYTDTNVGTNANNNGINGSNKWVSGQYVPNNIDMFAENFVSSDKFEFSPTTSNFQVCSINGLVQPSEVYVYERTTQNYLTLGYLEKFSNLDNISITQYRYNRGNGWVEVSDWATDDFTGYNVQDDILTYTIDVSKISADTLVLFNFTPNNIEDFTNQTFALYIKSGYTVIQNGVIYPAQTFSGDYYNNYNDDSNTDKIVDNNKNDSDKIVDTLTDTSEVDSQLNEFLSGDLANNLGYSPLENPFSSFLYNILTRFL